MDCNTAGCEFSATHWAMWRRESDEVGADELTGGFYCDDCATILERAGDDVGRIVEPEAAR